MDISVELKKRRKELRLTQTQLASCVGLKIRMIQYLEKDESHYTLPTLKKVCEALKVEIVLKPITTKNK